jgi:hypothetical protein
MPPGGNPRAVGAAVTAALCGSSVNDPPCPLAPHHVSTASAHADVVVRVLFAVGPLDEQIVRDQIDTALASGSFRGPDGAIERWQLVSSAPSQVHVTEFDHARRLAADHPDRRAAAT